MEGVSPLLVAEDFQSIFFSQLIHGGPRLLTARTRTSPPPSPREDTTLKPFKLIPGEIIIFLLAYFIS